MKFNRIIKSIFITFTLLFSFKLSAQTITLNYWSWSHTLDPFIEAFEKRHPDIKIKFTQFPYAQMQMKILTAMRSRNAKHIPDMIALESGFITDLVNKNIFHSLKDFGFAKYKETIVPYVWQTGLNKSGELVAVSWQATPGAFYYRRSLAKKYLGTDDPDKVSKLIDSWDKFFKVIEKINSGKEKHYFIMDATSVIESSISKYKQPLTQGTKLIVGDVINDLFSKLIKFAKLKAGANIVGDTMLSQTLISDKAFGYLLAPWFVGAKLQVYIPQQSGDWAVVAGPAAFSRGGTWLAIPKLIKDKQKLNALKLFFEELAFNVETSTKYVRQRGDFPANKLVLEQVKNYKVKFLNNQQQMKYLSTNIKDIYHIATKYDRITRSAITEIYSDMLINPDKYTVESATKKYIKDVKKLAPEIEIP